MTYRIELTRDAAKALRAIPKKDQIRIGKKIDSLAENLPNPSETKMKGDNPFHRVRVGNYRIIYEIQSGTLVILILKIGHRKEVYRRLS
ncbi:MAG: type II toxin-antitoxin system RelE/ParE family toxin [Desulfobacterales bacterium]|nr:type II toxin-antitoxin system RelE/ParE family toxin [Desulfobacterales bacterium]